MIPLVDLRIPTGAPAERGVLGGYGWEAEVDGEGFVEAVRRWRGSRTKRL
jgi:hypothetical protein